MNIRNIDLIGLFAGMLAACASPIQPDICATCCKQTGIQGATIVTVVVPDECQSNSRTRDRIYDEGTPPGRAHRSMPPLSRLLRDACV